MKTGIELIADERNEQINKHGRTLESDIVNNQYGELAVVARYLLSDFPTEQSWPRTWSREFKFQLDRKSKRERFIIAGALIAAELDRLTATSKNFTNS